MIDFDVAGQRLLKEFGPPKRETIKVSAWESGSLGVVLQTDQPNQERAAYVWLPYPEEGESVPEIALEYAAQSGRHSGTYASAGLEKDKPALKLIVRTSRELDHTIEYIKAMWANAPLPTVIAEAPDYDPPIFTSESSSPSGSDTKRPRREAIPKAVQREVWNRDGGLCVGCQSKERLCYDHVIPFSRGGSNTVRNLQILCERCNLSKGNRI